jgi:hypothetical protein
VLPVSAERRDEFLCTFGSHRGRFQALLHRLFEQRANAIRLSPCVARAARPQNVRPHKNGNHLAVARDFYLFSSLDEIELGRKRLAGLASAYGSHAYIVRSCT